MAFWTCPICGTNNDEASNPDVCIHGHPRATSAPQAGPAPSASGSGHGWRLTLPNHVVVPLAEGAVHIGRATPGIIGTVLCLFTHVHHEHVTLNVTSDAVDILVERGRNPVFEFSEGADPTDPAVAFHPEEIRNQRTLTRDDARTLCLGQCCFIRIDRGEA